MRAYERLLRYAQYDTASDERSETCPSTEKQRVLAEALAAEMREMGMTGVRVDENGYVYGCVPATAENRPVIGLIAHMDTVDCVPVAPVRARIVENYDGGAVRLENGDLLDPKVFPDIAKAKGKDLIVTDGNTLLGADDKAGVAEILTACERLLADRTIPHGKVMVGFTPDEEDRPRGGPLRHSRLWRGLRLYRGRRRSRFHRIRELSTPRRETSSSTA